jgi:hypothetical protein
VQNELAKILLLEVYLKVVFFVTDLFFQTESYYFKDIFVENIIIHNIFIHTVGNSFGKRTKRI